MQASVVVESLTAKGWIASVGVSSAISLILGFSMSLLTDADYPFADSFIAGTSVVAQWLIAQRKLQNWYFWIVIDIVAVGLFSLKGLWPTAILYMAFLIMAITGGIVWNREWQKQQT